MRFLRKQLRLPFIYALIIGYQSVLFYSVLPYGHDLRADLSDPLAESYCILKGAHHHSPDSRYSVFDHHIIERHDITPCLLCIMSNGLNSYFSQSRILNPIFNDFSVLKNDLSFLFKSSHLLLPENRGPPLNNPA